MIKFIKLKIKKNFEIFLLLTLILITAISTTFFNYQKKIQYDTYNNFIENIYLKKTLNHLINNLNPKYKKIKHKIQSGETFDKIFSLILSFCKFLFKYIFFVFEFW